jgi:hypothetical protein
MAECKETERELGQMRDIPQSNGDKDETIMKYFESLSVLTNRLENARNELAITLSAADAEEPAAFYNTGNDHQLGALELEVQQLPDPFNKLAVSSHAEGDMDQALELSQVSAELEVAQVCLVMAQSMPPT